MLLVFLDESGSLYTSYSTFQKGYEARLQAAKAGGGPFPRYPFFILAAVAFPESQYSTVDDWFRAMKGSYLGASPEDSGPEYEIRGSVLYALRTGKQPIEWVRKRKMKSYTLAQKAIWSRLTPGQLAQLELSVFDLFRRIRPAIWAVVTKQAHLYRRYKNNTWPPHYWALTYVQQRVAQSIEAQHGTYQRGLFVMDETSTFSTSAQFGEFLKIRDRINQTASWPVTFRRYLVDVPMMGKSHLIQALQLGDIVAHAIWENAHNTDTLGWFTSLEPLLAKHFRTNQHLNAGLTYIA